MEQTYNNSTTIKYNPANPPEMEVFKCPRLDCNKWYMDYESRASHMALDHGLMPKFLMEPGRKPTYFNKAQLGRLQRLGTQTSINKHRKMLGLFLQEGFEKKAIPREQRPRRVRLPRKEMPRPSLLGRLLGFIGVRKSG